MLCRRFALGNGRPHDQRTTAGLRRQLPESTAVDRLHVPCHLVQSLWHFVPDRVQGSRLNAVQVLPGIRLSAAQTVLPANLVHGVVGRHVHSDYHYGDCGAVREVEELSI